VTAFVEQQLYFFDTLWNNSISAEQKIREIKEGIEPDFIQPITNPVEIRRIQYDLLSSSAMEIMIIFPTSGIFTYYEEHLGIIQLFTKTSTANPPLQIRIMIPGNHKIRNVGQKLIEQYPKNIDILYLTQQPKTTILILVVDRKHSLYIEVKDTSNALGYGNDISSNMDAIFGLATFSNSKATVVGYASIFESLWKQSEIYEQLKESTIQLDDAKARLHDMKEYVDYILKEKQKHKPR
jgi:hypothetical protein